MTGSGLGPREYAVEPEHVPFAKRRNVKVVASVALVLAVGGGAFGVAQAFSSPSPKAAPPASGTNGSTPGGGGRGAAAPNRGGALRGMVTAIGTASFTITTRSGSEVIDVDAKTTYRAADGSSASFSALKVNEFVTVTVEPNVSPPMAVGVTTSTAGSFGGAGGGRFGGNLTVGSVTSVGANSFVINSRSFGGQGGVPTTSSVTVNVTSSTTFQSGSPTSGTSSASFSDVKKGVNVFVTGSKSGSTVDATTITIIPAGEFGGRGGGRYGGGFAGGGGGSSTPSGGT